MDYPAALLRAIAAPDSRAKDAILATIAPPADGAIWTVPPAPVRPGRPADWREGEPVRRRKGLGNPQARLRFLHAIHHIEMSAIDLAVLLCLRAPGAPAALHADFLAIAREEAAHALLVEDLLTRRGFPPGSDPIHHRLWETAVAAEDLGGQLVAVPRFLEARGLDVSADLLPRLAGIDAEAHAVIQRIYTDEIRHVAAGSRWHAWWCAQHGIAPADHFAQTAARLFPGQVPGPFPLDVPGRTAAGFAPAELAWLATG
jgi:uncharacterized ferritin-like protein (DUF455 family)